MKTYYDRQGNPVPRHLAIDPATGQVRDGITVSVPQRMCDSATVIVRDTPLTQDERAAQVAHDGYLARLTRRAKGTETAADAAPTPAEGRSGYLARMTRRAKGG